MRDPESWRPSKFVLRGGRLRASADRSEVSAGSRLAAELVAEAFGTHLPVHARGRLLDLGCGKVPLYLVYGELVSETTCVDWSDSVHGSQHVDKACDLSEPLPFADASFDTILLSDVLEHLPEPEALWREMARVLRPGGTILVSVPFLYWLHETPHDFYRYTEFALRRFVERAGLELRHVEPLGGALEVLVDISAKVACRVRKIGTAAAMALQGVAGLLRRTPPGRALARATAPQFPSGYFLIAGKPGG
jgi:SAM-dependent methyltransferase